MLSTERSVLCQAWGNMSLSVCPSPHGEAPALMEDGGDHHREEKWWHGYVVLSCDSKYGMDLKEIEVVKPFGGMFKHLCAYPPSFLSPFHHLLCKPIDTGFWALRERLLLWQIEPIQSWLYGKDWFQYRWSRWGGRPSLLCFFLLSWLCLGDKEVNEWLSVFENLFWWISDAADSGIHFAGIRQFYF